MVVEPEVRSRSLDELKIRITKKGVWVPKYTKTRGGKLRRERAAFYPDLPTAIRAETHKIGSVEDAGLRCIGLLGSVTALHKDIYENWKGKSEAERRASIQQMRELRDVIRGDRELSARSPIDRRIAVERLDKALADPRGGELPAMLIGVRNDLIARMGDLTRQKAFLPRRRQVLAGTKAMLDSSAFDMVDQLGELLKAAGRPEKLSVMERKELARRLWDIRDRLKERRAEERLSKTAYKHIDRAAVKFLRGVELQEAVDLMRKGNRAIAAHTSRYALLYPTRLGQVAKSGDPRFKTSIARNQAKLYHGNLEYWLSEAPPGERLSRAQVAEHLEAIGRVFPVSQFNERMKKAAESARRGDVESAKVAIQEAEKTLEPPRQEELFDEPQK